MTIIALTLTPDQIDRIDDDTLWNVAISTGLRDGAASTDVVWYDSEGTDFVLTGRALILGGRAFLWTTCDEAKEHDREVYVLGDDKRDQEDLARNHAKAVARSLGSLEQPVPACSEPAHDWHTEDSGLAENPGVFGHGGGVVIRHVCAHCGLIRVVDTWADDGRGGHVERTRYEDEDA